MFQNLPPDITEAAISLGRMMISGLFGFIGGIFSYLYAVYDQKIRPNRKELFLYSTLAFGVGMVAGEFWEYTPDYMRENKAGSLCLIGAYWNKVYSSVRDKLFKSNR